MKITHTVAAAASIAAVAALLTAAPGLADELPPYNPVVDPANFVVEVTNPYFPLKLGTVYIYDGNRDGAPRHAQMSVTAETKVIMGVTCVVVRDVSSADTEMVEK